ncbi:MAG: 3-hydroxyacyl-CoA dehydrogenase family protein [Runella zeae]
MRVSKLSKGQILLVGNHPSIYGLAVCLQMSGHLVLLKTSHSQLAQKRIQAAWEEVRERGMSEASWGNMRMLEDEIEDIQAELAFVVTGETLHEKREAVKMLELILPDDAIIGVNSESIALSELQKGARHPQRIMVTNWVDPVYSTLFLEIVGNDTTDTLLLSTVEQLAIEYWGKDPYIIQGDFGVRMPLISALIREAFFLVRNGYATIEDIDRACRNDAGYYLPFAGNLRYMDLMGTYAYGMVMKDLNPELSTDTDLPSSFTELLEKGATGMKAGEGFYKYDEGEPERWEELMQKFSFEIRDLIDKYPFSTVAEEVSAINKK